MGDFNLNETSAAKGENEKLNRIHTHRECCIAPGWLRAVDTFRTVPVLETNGRPFFKH